MDPAVDDGELAGRLTVHVCIHSMEHGGLTLDARGGEAGNLPDLGGASGIRVSNREDRNMKRRRGGCKYGQWGRHTAVLAKGRQSKWEGHRHERWSMASSVEKRKRNGKKKQTEFNIGARLGCSKIAKGVEVGTSSRQPCNEPLTSPSRLCLSIANSPLCHVVWTLSTVHPDKDKACQLTVPARLCMYGLRWCHLTPVRAS